MRTALLSAFLLGLASPAYAEVASVYTDIENTKTCITLDKAEEGDGDWENFVCSGYMGFPVTIDYGDARTSVRYGFPDAERVWESFETFNSVGNKVEWRVEKTDGNTVPYATIVRWKVADPEDANKQIEVLVVSKVGQPKEQKACVVGLVLASGKPDANELARKIADEQTREFSCGDERTVVGEPMPTFARQSN